jgi:hypothetical protein
MSGEALAPAEKHPALQLVDPARCPSVAEVFYDAFLPRCVSFPSSFHLLIGQKVADLKPFSAASFAACELRPPVLHVNTSVLSFGIVGR